MTRMIDSDPIDVAAADWFARLEDSSVSLEEVTAWQEWMLADIRHARAFARMEEAWDVVSGVSPAAVAAAAAPRASRIPRFALAASLVIAVCALAWAGFALREARQSSLHTDIGENRSLRLTDGSRVTLGGDTALAVHFDDRERLIEITRGEALFDVAREAARPFKVRAGNTTVTAVGTAFNVRRGSDRVVVAVVDGRVILASGSSSARSPIQLGAGQEAMIDQAGAAATTHVADPAAAVSWRHGLLSFQSEPLRYVLEDVNRYATKPIAIEDPRVADLRITGTVVSSNLPEWISSLESAFGLRAVEERDRIVLVAAP